MHACLGRPPRETIAPPLASACVRCAWAGVDGRHPSARPSVLRWVVCLSAFAMATALVHRPVMALITADVSRLVRVSDESTIAAQMLSLPTPGLLVTCSFVTVADAMCWLTNPLPADVVQAAEQSGMLGPVVHSCVDGGWLAVATRGSRSCFHVDSSDTNAAVMLLNGAASPICAVGHFAAADAAHAWLSGAASAELLTLLWESAGLGNFSSAPRRLAPPSTSTRSGIKRRLDPPARMPVPRQAADPPPAEQAASESTLPSAYGRRGDARQVAGRALVEPTSFEPVGPGPAAPARMPQRGVPGHTEVELVPARSPFAVWSALEALTEVVLDVDDRPARSSSSFGMRGSSHQAAAPCGHGGGTSLTRANGPDWSTAFRALPLSAGSTVGHGSRTVRAGGAGDEQSSSTMRRTPTNHPAVRVPSAETPVGQRSTRAVDAVLKAKRIRLANEGGAASALNPAGGPRNDGPTHFSRADFSRMMAATKRAWEEADALAARRRADLRTNAALKPVGAAAPGNLSPSFTLSRPRSLWARSSASARAVSSNSASFCSNDSQSKRTVGLSQDDGLLPLTQARAALGASVVRGAPLVASQEDGALGRLAATGDWADLFRLMVLRNQSTFVTGGPGVGKSTFLKGFHKHLKEKWSRDGEVVIVAPTGSSAKTANGQTYHSFFGFPRDYRAPAGEPGFEAARLLRQERFRPISRRLSLVRVLLLDEVSMVPADRFGVMVELLRQSRPATSPPCVIYTFGDFLQLGPLTGTLAFQSAAWRSLFGVSMLELTRVFRQSDAGFVEAINDARYGRCSTAVMSLMDDCAVSDERYRDLKCNVLHLMPRHDDVQKHNADCLKALCGSEPPLEFLAVDTVEQEKDRDQGCPAVDLRRITEHSRNAALVDCVAPRCVLHCLHARVMLTNNQYLALGLYHGSIGTVSSYKEDGTPVVRFEHHTLPQGVDRGIRGVHDAGADWLEVECPPVAFEMRMLAHPGAVAIRRQVPFVLGWGITVHRSQSLSLSEAVLDIGQAFGAGMVNAAISRVGDKKRMHVKSFSGSRLVADPDAVQFYREGLRL